MLMEVELEVPDSQLVLKPGNIIRLGRFDDKDWRVEFGWYSFGGNRAVCGWYLTSDGGRTTKPIQLPDLDDIYVIR